MFGAENESYAVIFAAGSGSRINAVCTQENVPHKALLIIGGRASLDHGLVSMNTARIDGAHTIVVTHTHEQILEERYGNRLMYMHQEQLNGTGGAIKQIIQEKLIPNEERARTLLANADDLRALSAETTFALTHGESPVTLLLSSQEIASGRNIYVLNSQGTKVVDITRSPVYDRPVGHFTGICVFSNSFLYDNVPLLRPRSLYKGEIGVPDLFAMALSANVPIEAVLVEKWLSINTPEGLGRARSLYNEYAV